MGETSEDMLADTLTEPAAVNQAVLGEQKHCGPSGRAKVGLDTAPSSVYPAAIVIQSRLQAAAR